jgi:hypothetical protein
MQREIEKSVNLDTKSKAKRTLEVIVDWEIVLKLSLTNYMYVDLI